MDQLLVILFLASSVFWAWVVLGAGAEALEDRFIAGVLLWFHVPNLSADAIRLLAAITWIGQTIWFIAALVFQAVRPFGL